MKHLRTDWQGIQDLRAWTDDDAKGSVLMRLLDLEDHFDKAERLEDAAETVYQELQGLIFDLLTLSGLDPERPESAPGSSILADEPVFMVRSKTKAAYGTVVRYAQLASAEGADPAYCARVKVWAAEMRAYRDQKLASGEWLEHAPDAPELLPYPGGPQEAEADE